MPPILVSALAKGSVALLLSGLVVLYWSFKQRLTPPLHRQPTALLLAFVAFRLVPFGLVYVLLDQAARSDVHMFYVAAQEALQLRIVYDQFDTAYSPLFPYLTALPLLLWNSPKSIILLLISLEGLALALTFRYYRRQQLTNHEPYQRALLYLLLPVPLVLSVLGGQEDILMWLFGAAALLAHQRRRSDFRLGLILGVGFVFTKAILILTLIPVFFLVENRWRYVLGLLAVGLPTLAIMYGLVGLQFLEPVQQANDPRAPNLWTILRPVLGEVVPLGQQVLNWVGLVAVLGVGCYAAVRHRRAGAFESGFVQLWVLTYAFMMVVQQSSLANYAYVFVMPLVMGALTFDTYRHRILLLVFNFAVVLQPALWWGLNMPLYRSFSDLTTGWAVAEYLLQITLVGCLLALLIRLSRNVRPTPVRYRPAERV